MRHTTLRLIAAVAAMSLLIAALPMVAGAAPKATKHLNRDGSIPAKWDLPTPEIPTDDTTMTAAGGNGNGHNSISFSNFDDGDIISVFPGSTFTGHTGIWKDSLYRTLYSLCIWSANTSPANGVQLEKPIKYRGYDYAFGIWVPSKSSYGSAVVNWCAAQKGEPYDITSSKTSYSRWYCSKLPWAGWKVKTGVDLDANGGAWVTPADLVNDTQTKTFAYSD